MIKQTVTKDWHSTAIENLARLPINEKIYRQYKPLHDIIYEQLNKSLSILKDSKDELERAKYKDFEDILAFWHLYKRKTYERKDNHFGYPLHMKERSFLVDFFRIMESLEVAQNNVADIHDTPIEHVDISECVKTAGSNYSLDTKSIEWDVVRLIAENLGLPKQPELQTIKKNPEKYKDGYWGYVTSGGTEGNFWGINQGFYQYPNGILYFSEGAHYSIPKAGKDRHFQVIPQTSADDEAIDVHVLIESVKANWNNMRKPAIIALTVGTTKFGAIDDVGAIKRQLKEMQIPHYIHVDAALTGGIPRNQLFAPKFGSIDDWGYNSVSVSLHKYLGYPATKGVLISTRKPTGNFIDYIGQDDNTVLGSRDVPAFSLRQQVMEVLKYSEPQEYIRNINIFEGLLESANLNYNLWTDGINKGNIFVFKVDKEAPNYGGICRRWQCSEFVGKDGINRIHIVIFSTHSIQNMQLLVNDIAKIVI